MDGKFGSSEETTFLLKLSHIYNFLNFLFTSKKDMQSNALKPNLHKLSKAMPKEIVGVKNIESTIFLEELKRKQTCKQYFKQLLMISKQTL